MTVIHELKAREEEVAEEWEWLNETLNELSGARAEQAETSAFRMLQMRAFKVGLRRVGLRVQMAEASPRNVRVA